MFFWANCSNFFKKKKNAPKIAIYEKTSFKFAAIPLLLLLLLDQSIYFNLLYSVSPAGLFAELIFLLFVVVIIVAGTCSLVSPGAAL